ncbi:MAG: type 2 lantipeptide synthetase LanM, partial [Myxococcales bacterium]|nr:type 2 lantipeptide synthetase LanM [Myxococcales bacterium]
ARGGLIDELTRAPAWARLLGARLERTIAAARLFLARWERDRDALARAFPELLRARALEFDVGLSDPHAGGRTVIRVLAPSGAALYYKPRPLSGERLLAPLLEGLHAALGEAPPVTPRSLERDDYAWVAHVTHRPLDTGAAWRAYHRRAGALLLALYVAGVTDAHADNLIAHGGWPLLIDAECLLHPTLRASLSSTPADDSVARVGLLPRWARDERGLWYSQAGLSDPRRNAPRRPTWRVVGVNTDAMTCARSYAPGETGANAPWADPEAAPTDDRAEDVLVGFTRAYRAFQAGASTLAAPLLEQARRHRGRFVLRPTAHYAALSDHLQRPATSDGAAITRALEALRRPFAGASARDQELAARLTAAELDQLLAGDIPVFYADADGDALHPPDGPPIAGALEHSAVAALVDRLARLGEADLERQRATLRDAFAASPTAPDLSAAARPSAGTDRGATGSSETGDAETRSAADLGRGRSDGR